MTDGTADAAIGLAVLAVALTVALAVEAQPTSTVAGIESDRESLEALALKGDPARGKEAYEVCSACHLPNGSGRPDGTFPQLAGQHARVLVKQIADIRAGRRDNPIMYPFAIMLTDPQELADVAAYLQSLPIPPGNGKGPGIDLSEGEKLYRRDCVQCHSDRGQGNAEKFYPALAGQHYEYLLRQIRDIAASRRRNADPDMVKVVQGYRDDQLQAVVDYVSRLSRPERAGEAGGS